MSNSLRRQRASATINWYMIQVTRKDSQEANENLVRRFNRKVQQSGLLQLVKALQAYEKPISKSERRRKAIVRKTRRAEKLKRIRLGGR